MKMRFFVGAGSEVESLVFKDPLRKYYKIGSGWEAERLGGQQRCSEKPITSEQTVCHLCNCLSAFKASGIIWNALLMLRRQMAVRKQVGKKE